VVDGAPPSEPSQEPAQHEELPDRLRVHSLARTLGTTSKRVLDALSALDGRIRSAHSTVDRDDAVRVRDLLAAAQPEASVTADAPVAAETPVAAGASLLVGEPTDEPESRLMLETAVGRPHYMPLFVAPQPIEIDDGSADDAADSDDSETDDDEEQADRPANRRRRRGRRGRGRGRGEQGGSDNQSDSQGEAGGDDGEVEQRARKPARADSSESADADDQDSEDSDDGNDDDENGSGEAGNRRRRRRRRRKSALGDDNDEGPAPDDPPNTVVHERSPRTGKSDDNGSNGSAGAEIKGIDGSTRLEAKRQRRRDGRDAGRRRPPVLTEAEFLARREAVERMMVVRDRVRTEPPHPGARYTQIAVLEDGIVVEHFVTSAASGSLVGNIYLGIVQNVLPSMEAAFVDIGRGRNGVLYAGEVNWEAAGLGGADRKIEQALKPGDYVVVQVSKDPVGH